MSLMIWHKRRALDQRALDPPVYDIDWAGGTMTVNVDAARAVDVAVVCQ